MIAMSAPFAVSGEIRDHEAGKPVESIEATSEQAEP